MKKLREPNSPEAGKPADPVTRLFKQVGIALSRFDEVHLIHMHTLKSHVVIPVGHCRLLVPKIEQEFGCEVHLTSCYMDSEDQLEERTFLHGEPGVIPHIDDRGNYTVAGVRSIASIASPSSWSKQSGIYCELMVLRP